MKHPDLQGCDGLLKLFLHPGDKFIQLPYGTASSWVPHLNFSSPQKRWKLKINQDLYAWIPWDQKEQYAKIKDQNNPVFPLQTLGCRLSLELLSDCPCHGERFIFGTPWLAQAKRSVHRLGIRHGRPYRLIGNGEEPAAVPMLREGRFPTGWGWQCSARTWP